jgi:prepilin-type N-terminal cleavage/methylation domain-containing protein
MSDRHSRDDGFTLVELLIAVVVLGLIMSALAGAMVVLLRTQDSAASSLRSSEGTQGLTTWFPSDAQSTPPGAYDTASGTVSGCGTDPGTSIVRFQWQETVGTTTTYVAAYRMAQAGSEWQVVRVSCTIDSGGTVGSTKTLVAAHNLLNGTAFVLTPNGRLLTLQLTSAKGDVYSVTGSRLNTPTSLCHATLTTSPGTFAATLTAAKTLPPSPAFSVTASSLTGTCATPLRLHFQTGVPPDPVVSMVMTQSSASWVGTIPSSLTWTGGTKAIEVDDANGAVLGSVSLALTDPAALACSATSVTASPTQQSLSGSNLTQPVTVTAVLNGACQMPPMLVLAPNSGSTVSVTMTNPSSDAQTWLVVFGGSSPSWTAGQKSIDVFQSSAGSPTGSSLGTTQLTLSLPCQVTPAPITPSTASVNGDGQLLQTVTISVMVTASCTTTPQLRYVPDGVNVQWLAMSGSGANWTATLVANTNPPTWAGGSVSFTFYAQDRATLIPITGSSTPVLTTTLTACRVKKPTFSRDPLTLNGNGTIKFDPISITVPVTGTCSGLTMTFTPDSPTVYSPTLTPGGSQYTGAIAGAKWTSGTKTYVVRDGAGNLLYTSTLDVN